MLALGVLSTSFVFAQATDDNEIKITQTGDTLKLYIDQIGFGNKVGGDDASGGSLSSPVMSKFQTLSSDSQSRSNTLLLPTKIKSASNLSALKP